MRPQVQVLSGALLTRLKSTTYKTHFPLEDESIIFSSRFSSRAAYARKSKQEITMTHDETDQALVRIKLLLTNVGQD
jgi:hypothetical protein